MTVKTHFAKRAGTLCRRFTTPKRYVTTDITKVDCRTCIRRYNELPTVPVLASGEGELIFTIYFCAWGADEGMEESSAFSPYLKFSTSVTLEQAIEVALVIKKIEPRHIYAISVAGEDHGWYWMERGGRTELGLEVR